jgi:hypothetical protein
MKMRIGWSAFSFGIAEGGLVLHAKLLKTDFSVEVRGAEKGNGSLLTSLSERKSETK